MRPWPWIAVGLLFIAACGNEPPAPPPAPPPKVAGPSKPPEPVPDSVKADNRQRDEALQGITGARTAEEAQLARDSYTGTKHAVNLDVALERKLRELDFSAFNAAKATVLKTATPSAAVAAAKEYTGERYASDLDKALWDHMNALVKKDPSLASQLPAAGPVVGTTEIAPTVPSPGSDKLNALLEECKTETEAAAALAEVEGKYPKPDIEAALELWRWSKPEWIHEAATEVQTVWWSAHALSSGGFVCQKPRDFVTVHEADGAIRYTLGGAQAKFMAAAVSPEESLIVSCNVANELELWNLADGSRKAHLGPVGSPTNVFAFSADMTLLATGSDDRKLRLWSVEKSSLLREMENPRGRVQSAKFSRDGSKLFAVIGAVSRMYEVNSGVELAVFPGKAGSIAVGDWSPDESTVAMNSGDGKIWLYDAKTAKALRSISAAANCTGFYWLPSGRHLMLVTAQQVLLYDVANGKEVATYPLTSQVRFNSPGPGFTTLVFSQMDYGATKRPVIHVFGRPR